MKNIIFACAMLVITAFSLQAQQIPQHKLDTLINWSKRAHSDALFIIQDNQILVDESFGEPKTPTYIASVAKAVISVAITKLLSDGKIKSIDQPISDFYPEWKQGRKRKITLRMILSHTSGLQNEKNSRLEIETGPAGKGDDLVKLALAAELTDEPGTVYNYNNKAICLLPGIIEKASGMRMDYYFEKVFFKPMGINNFEWKRDQTGTPQGHASLSMLPADLAKFGQLMLNKGDYKKMHFFESRWADSAITASQAINPTIGMVWNRFVRNKISYMISDDVMNKLAKASVPDSILTRLRPLVNKEFRYDLQRRQALEKALSGIGPKTLQDAFKNFSDGLKGLFIKKEEPQLVGFHHSGSWGNYLVVIPEQRLVIVRLVKRDANYNEQSDLMGGFTSKVFDLFRAN